MVVLTKMAGLPPLCRSFTSEYHATQKGFKYVSSTPCNSIRKGSDYMKTTKMNKRSETQVMLSLCEKTKIYRTIPLSMVLHKEVLCPVWYASIEEHHRSSLDTYFGKLKSEAKHVPSSDVTELQCSELQEGLISLERYFTTLKKVTKSEECISSTSVMESEGSFPKPRYRRGNFYATNKSMPSPLYEEKESANLYLIGTLLSINVAVFLFELASPVKNFDNDLFSIPLMYGAKVNELIVDGEWWRLLTPMFLHSDVFHIGISSWMLLSFGPRVCKRYGSITFVLIYILGGISGTFTSFLHTTEPTVGGSGPVFAVIGAWLIYQIKNKGVTSKEVSESMFQKALVATALSCLLGNFGPIDTWTNVGATMSGIIYGYFTSPALQVNDTTSKGIHERLQKEITLFQKPVNPWKSLVIFAVCVSAMSSLLLLSDFAQNEIDLVEFFRQ